MAGFCAKLVLAILPAIPIGMPVAMLCVARVTEAQRAPATSSRPWDGPALTRPGVPARHAAAFTPDPAKVYLLPELVDIAEQNNPETRVAWENAKVRAADLGIQKAALYPTLAATVLAQSSRNNVFFAPAFYRQTTASYAPAFLLDYTIFDFGRRSGAISIARNNLLAANFFFNDTHRQVIFQVMAAYYRVLNSKGKEDAAEANLKNAQTVQQAAEARLQQGLATLPDVLEARSAAAQADYDLQAAIGATEIARGDLSTALGISPTSEVRVEGIEALTIPQALGGSEEESIDRALAQRPDLMQKVAALRAAESEVKAARSEYYPTLSFEGNGGLARFHGVQDLSPGVYSSTEEFWSAKLSLNWTLFDGFAREHQLAGAKADRKKATAEVDAVRDQVENQVWSAYSTARTALREQKAAAALLTAANESYNAALQSYSYGVRSQIDVVSAQRALAEARNGDVNARTQLLTGMAALAFQTGDLLHAKGP